MSIYQAVGDGEVVIWIPPIYIYWGESHGNKEPEKRVMVGPLLDNKEISLMNQHGLSYSAWKDKQIYKVNWLYRMLLTT